MGEPHWWITWKRRHSQDPAHSKSRPFVLEYLEEVEHGWSTRIFLSAGSEQLSQWSQRNAANFNRCSRAVKQTPAQTPARSKSYSPADMWAQYIKKRCPARRNLTPSPQNCNSRRRKRYKPLVPLPSDCPYRMETRNVQHELREETAQQRHGYAELNTQTTKP